MSNRTGDLVRDNIYFLLFAALSIFKHYNSYYVHVGSYTDTFGIKIVREDVAKYISRRDGYPADTDNIILTNGGAKGIQVHW